MKGKRKTISATDVINSMEDMEFDQFVEPLKQVLEGNLLSLFVTFHYNTIILTIAYNDRL